MYAALASRDRELREMREALRKLKTEVHAVLGIIPAEEFRRMIGATNAAVLYDRLQLAESVLAVTQRDRCLRHDAELDEQHECRICVAEDEAAEKIHRRAADLNL